MKKIIISTIAILAVFAVATTTFAANVLDELRDNGNAIPKEDPNPQDIPTGQDLNTTKNVVNNNVVNNNVVNNENLPTTTPHTGIGDYSSVIFIGVFAVSAVYAYKKVKEYNV